MMANPMEENIWNGHPYEHITLGGPVSPQMPTTEWNGLVIVGEAPGSTEVMHGVPFSGPSGRLLSRMLDSIGIDRDATIICNTFSMRPAWTITAEHKKQGNNIALFFGRDDEDVNKKLPPYQGRYVRTGPDEDIRNLWRLLKLHAPKAIITCGSIPTWALTGIDRITPVVGSEQETRCVPATVFPTFHPAYAQHKQQEEIATMIASHINDAVTKAGIDRPLRRTRP